MKTEGREQVVEWMKALDKKTRIHVDTLHVNKSGFWRNLRSITSEEWEMVQRYINEYEFPCYILGEAYGFVFCVYSHTDLTQERPDPILGIEDSCFPFESSKNRGFSGQDETLKILEHFTHNSRNQELLKWYGFPQLDPILSYSY